MNGGYMYFVIHCFRRGENSYGTLVFILIAMSSKIYSACMFNYA